MVFPCETPDILAANWRAPEAEPSLEPGAVHLWAVVLDEHLHEAAAQHLPQLAPDEQERAMRIRRQPQQQRFIVGRSLLRQLLGRYLATPGHELEFNYNGMGKPRLPLAEREGLSFNLAHSGSLAVYAVARGAAVGVDVEAINPQRKLAEIAQRFFTPTEWQAMALLDDRQQIEAFYRIWTQKEAYVKAHGNGLLAQIDQFDVAVSPETPLGLQDHRVDKGEIHRWQFIAPTGLKGFAATLATDGPCDQVHTLRWLA